MTAFQKGLGMARSVMVAKPVSSTAPRFWKKLLGVVAVGKAALGGAGLALAIAGAFNIAAAVTAQHWLHDIQKNYLDYVALGGGAVGGAIGFATRIV